MLLDLPGELLLQILATLEPDDFYVALLTCKTIRNHALNSQTLLLHQLRKIPGRQDTVERRNLWQLHNTFIRRAKRHLLNGVQTLADVVCFKPPFRLAARKSVLEVCSCRTKHTLFAAVFPGSARVGIYSLRSKIPRLKALLSPSSLGLEDGPSRDLDFDVVRIAFHDGTERATSFQCLDKISVLYKYRVVGETSSVFVQEAKSSAQGLLKLVTFSLDTSFDATVQDIRDISVEEDEEAIALAVADDGTAVIGFQNRLKRNLFTLISYAKSMNRTYDQSPQFTVAESPPAHDGEWNVSSISIIGRRVDIFLQGLPIPSLWIENCLLKHHFISIIDNALPEDLDAGFSKASMGLPIACEHVHNCRDPSTDEEYCINTILHLVIKRTGPLKGCAYLLKAVHYPGNCEKYCNRRRYPTLEYHYVARLGGTDFFETNSNLGLVMAVSHKGNRVAMATWKEVFIWEVHAEAFLNKSTKPRPRTPPDGVYPNDDDLPYFSEVVTSDDDHAYLDRCGHDYFQCYNPHEDIVNLKPIRLPSAGVVYNLAFNGNNTLWGLTDSGIVRWHFDSFSDGCREFAELDVEVKESDVPITQNVVVGKGKGKGKVLLSCFNCFG